MVQIRWSFLAVEDLKAIFNFISKDSTHYAKIQVMKLKLRTKILKTQPFSGRFVPEYKNENFRELIEGNYRIIYKIVNKNKIDIITIHHSARDLNQKELF